MSLYMYRFDVVNTNMVLRGAGSRAGQALRDERRLRHVNTHSGAVDGVSGCD
jgi:hypothetical protein